MIHRLSNSTCWLGRIHDKMAWKMMRKKVWELIPSSLHIFRCSYPKKLQASLKCSPTIMRIRPPTNDSLQLSWKYNETRIWKMDISLRCSCARSSMSGTEECWVRSDSKESRKNSTACFSVCLIHFNLIRIYLEIVLGLCFIHCVCRRSLLSLEKLKGKFTCATSCGRSDNSAELN